MSIAEKFDNVSVVSKANVYFDGKVVSHSIYLQNGQKKTIGLIFPGSFTFSTGAPEKMEMVAGCCSVRLKGQNEWKEYKTGEYFKVPANSAFDITIENGIMEYICTYE